MTTFANSGSIQPVQGGEVACCSIAGGPFAAVDAYVSGGGGASLLFMLFATVGTLRTLIATAPYSGPTVGAPGQGSVLEWTVIGQPQATNPVIAGGSQYDLVVFGLNGAGQSIRATLAGTNAYDASVAASAAAALPSNYGSTTVATNVGCAQFADVGANQSGLPPNVAFDVLVSCGAGSVEALVGSSGPTGGTDGLADVIRQLPLPVGTQYRLAVRETQGQPLAGSVTASLATYSSNIPGASAGTLNGDVHGPDNANLIHNFAELKATTLENFNPLVGTGNAAVDQAAWDAALAGCLAGLYGEIKLGAKTYLTNTANHVPAGVKITGQGCLSIVHATADINVFIPDGEETWFDNFVITGTGAGVNQIGIANAPVGSPAHSGFSRMRVTSMTFKSLATAAILTYQLPNQPPFIGPYVQDVRIEDCGIGLWFLGEYSTVIGMQIEHCGVGVEVEGGNQVFIGGSITNCTTSGVQLDGGGNDGHGVFLGIEINHNSGVQTISTTGALVNGERFVDCMMFGGPINLTNTHSVYFDECEIDVSAYNFNNCVNTVFNRPLLPGNAFANTINNAAGGNPSSTSWIDPRDLNGLVPSFVAIAIDGTALGSNVPADTQRGVAASGGGTFVAALNSQAPAPLRLPPNGTFHVRASVKMTGGSPVSDAAGFDTECILMVSAGVASLPAAIAPSANPSTTIAASTAGFIGGGPTPPSAVFSILAGNLILTTTNPGAVNATVQVNFDIKMAS